MKETQKKRFPGEEDDVVISGISCRLPEADNMKEFRYHLWHGNDMVTENRRWQKDTRDSSNRMGTLRDLSHFDAGYFSVNPKLANVMDPQLRILLEVTQEAMVDAGMLPHDLRESNTAVYVACGLSENMEAFSTDQDHLFPYNPIGNAASMFANRISFAFDFKGQSYTLRNGYTSGLVALDRSRVALKTGQCTSAVVAGCNLCLKAATSDQLDKIGLLSADGACHCFDAKANGYVRSEGIIALFVQRKSAAKRIYCSVLNTNVASYCTPSPSLPPCIEEQTKFLQQTYQEAGVTPGSVLYVETSGCSAPRSEAQEVEALARVIGCQRQEPLLIGSVLSNVGHVETASDLVGVAKLILAMEEDIIPANLHYSSPNPDMTAIISGQLKVVTERTRLPGNSAIVALNSYGPGNLYGHAIFAAHKNQNSLSCSEERRVRLFTYSARTKDGLESVFRLVRKNEHNLSLQALLQETADVVPMQHPHRGYMLVNGPQGQKEIKICDTAGTTRPVWFVYSGMGSQWPGMGRMMMEFEVFRQSIDKCDGFLQKVGLHLKKLLMEGEDNAYESVLRSFVGLASIQIALTDMLKCMGVEPDGILGHSVGELGCGYADGSLTAEETVLAAYWRGRCVQEAKLPPGGMAAIGMTWEEATAQCPPGVVPACHNAEKTVTVSGPVADIAKFVAKLKEKQIFAREVNSAGVAFHSKAMYEVAPALLARLEKVIIPKQRGKKWISSSIPESKWNAERSKWSSAEYIVNNLVSPVLFQEALHHVPENACVIEISPHCLLQSVLKRSLDKKCSIFGLMKRLHGNNQEFFLSNLGQCYLEGVHLRPLGMYPAVQFPVPRGTPMISPALKWDHTQKWSVAEPDSFLSEKQGSLFHIDLSSDSKYYFVNDHKINGLDLFPASGYVTLAWKALAKAHGKLFTQMPVTLKNVVFHQATILPKSGKLKFQVNFARVTGSFEISHENDLVASGYIHPSVEIPLENKDSVPFPLSPRRYLEPELSMEDIYKELRLRGYDFGPNFRSIVKTTSRGEEGYLRWSENWILLLDGMIQMHLLVKPEIKSALPTGIRRLSIDPMAHGSHVMPQKDNNFQIVKVLINKHSDTTVAGGATMQGVSLTRVHLRPHDQEVVIGEMTFVPNYQDSPCHQGSASVELAEYAVHCCNIAKSVFSKFKLLLSEASVPNNKVFEEIGACFAEEECSDLQIEIKEKEMTKNSLLKTLTKIATMKPVQGIVANMISVLSAFQSDLKQDRLLTSMVNQENISVCLDIVTENLASRTFRILEVKGTKENFSSLIIDHLQKIQKNIVACVTGQIKQDTGFEAINWTLDHDSRPKDCEPFQLLVLHGFLHGQLDILRCLKNISEMLSPGGFVLLLEVTHNHHIQLILDGLMKPMMDYKDTRTLGWYCDTKTWQQFFKMSDFEIVVEKADGLLHTLFLLRKKTEVSLETQTMVHVDDFNFSWLDNLKEKFAEVQTKPKGHNLWLLADKERQSGVQGLVRCLRQEPGGDRVRCVFHADDTASGLPDDYLEKLVEKDCVMNVYKNGIWGTYRHLLPKSPGTQALEKEKDLEIIMRRYGDMSSFCWSEVKDIRPETTKDKRSKVVCDVHYVALNTADHVIATGKLVTGNSGGTLCTEFSGVTQEGRRVMGLAPNKALSRTVLAESDHLWDIPETWSLKEGATVVWAYGMANYALNVRGKLPKDGNILIHDGASDVGQAAIAIALSCCTNVYVTVRSDLHKEVLCTQFPKLSKDQIYFPHQSNIYEADILRATKGEGLSMVLTSQMKDNLPSDVRILKQGGKLMELHTYGQSEKLLQNTVQGSYELHGIHIESLHEINIPSVAEMMRSEIKTESITPLPHVVFPLNRLKQAFSTMTTDNGSVSKVLVEVVPDTPKTSLLWGLPVRHWIFCPPDKSYIITGGLGGFGIELAQWLVDHGARKIVLVSRSGVKNSYQARKLLQWRDQGVTVRLSNDDICTKDGMKDLFDEATGLGGVAGVFHLAMVLKDGLFENQTMENFEAVCKAKVDAVINLDLETRSRCKDSLDWFVVFSSVTSGFGNAGQTNYGFANSVMERVCEKRKSEGYPALAIQWGPIADVGVLALDKKIVAGAIPQRLVSCLEVMETLLHQSHPVVSSHIPVKMDQSATQSHDKTQQSLTAAILQIIGIQPGSKPNPDKPLLDLGLDSLMTAEIKQLLDHEFDISISVDNIRQLTIRELKKMLKEDIEHTTTEDSTSSPLTRASEELVAMETIKHLNDIKNYENPVFVIHSLGGTVSILSEIVSGLNAPVYGVQLTKDAKASSISTLAVYYLQEIDTVCPDLPYDLVGVSFGAVVALEMRSQLEKFYYGADRKFGKLVLVDSSPFIIPDLYDEQLTALRDLPRYKQDSVILTSFVKSLTGDTSIHDLPENDSLDSKTERVLKYLMDTHHYQPRDHITMAVGVFYMLSSMAVSSVCDSKVTTDVTLLRPVHPSPSYCIKHPDYGLGQFVEGRVDVVTAQFTHADLNTDCCKAALEDILSK